MKAAASRAIRAGVVIVALVLALAGVVYSLNLRGEDPIVGGDGRPAAAVDAALIERGGYLARAGNCIGCHTARGGTDYAGGRGVETPFGTIYAPNLTPDDDTGLGRWSAAEFWRAMHNGRSRDGRLLYPAFPYPNYTHVTREDSDAIFAYLRSLPPVREPPRAHELRFPYNAQAALAVWRALYFSPQTFLPDPSRSDDWNRGRYLVQGLGHCNACHAQRNLLGATTGDIELGGGLIPMQNWYAPSLVSAKEAGVGDWPIEEVVRLLKTGVSDRASVIGPMAEVVFRSTQYMNEADLRAIAVFLREQSQAHEPDGRQVAGPIDEKTQRLGEQVYADQCASCHGDDGRGATGIYPPLAGNRAVTLDNPANVVKAILNGGFPPTTAGNPRPFGMPPFGQTLSDAEVAAVASFVRQTWGNGASTVSTVDVSRAR